MASIPLQYNPNNALTKNISKAAFKRKRNIIFNFQLSISNI